MELEYNTFAKVASRSMRAACMPRKLSGACAATVGKHAAKASYEMVRSVAASACSQREMNFEARGPGDGAEEDC